MGKYGCIIWLFLLGSLNLKGQECDCKTAKEISDTVYNFPTPKPGFGLIRELQQKGKLDSFAFKSEKNIYWLKFTIQSDEEFSFSIRPDNVDDDYDFMMFDGSVPHLCDSLINYSKTKAIRSNISRNDKLLNSITGLSVQGTSEFVGIGKGNSFSKPVQAMAGNVYYLAICCDKQPKSGFKLSLYHTIKTPPVDPTLETLKWLEEELKSNRNRLTVMTRDSLGLINTSFQYFYSDSDSVFKRSGASAYTIPFKQPVNVSVSAPGYLLFKKLYMPLPDSSGVKDTIFLQKVKTGDYIRFTEFYFEGNTDKLLPKSTPALEVLTDFLLLNPEMKIEIEGHVNGPLKKNSREFRKLSEDRAFAVRKFLMWKGIKKNRIKVEGYGNSQMLFPEPQNEEQGIMNRRVEIKVISVTKED